MGLYDRDYYRNSPENNWGNRNTGSRHWFGRIFAGKSVVFFLIMMNVVLYLANGLFFSENNFLTKILSMNSDTLRHPLYWFEFLTYGFVQSPDDPRHIIFNMIALFFFGPPIERRLGSREFLLFYLLSVVVGGIVWGFLNLGAGNVGMLGASGAISAVVILFAFLYPQAKILLYFFIPIPVWLFGIAYVVMDAMGALGGGMGGNVAHSVHLTGAAVGALYFLLKCRLSTPLDSLSRRFRAWGKPKLRIHQGDEAGFNRGSSKPTVSGDGLLEREVDRILKKISLSGEASLTEAERATLQKASREYQKRMKK